MTEIDFYAVTADCAMATTGGFCMGESTFCPPVLLPSCPLYSPLFHALTMHTNLIILLILL
jgi:hypothetical protein